MALIILLAFIVVALTAAFSLLESAITAIDEIRLTTLLHQHPKTEAKIRQVFKQKREHISALVLLNTLVSISGSMALGAMAATSFDDRWVSIFSALLGYIMLVFAKVLPKLIGVQIADKAMIRYAPLIHVLYRITQPLLLLGLFWIIKLLPKPKEAKRTSSDLRSIIRHYNQQGFIDKRQSLFAQAILKSDQRCLSEVIQNAEPAICLSFDDTVGSVIPVLKERPCKRYLVMDGDEAVGVVLYRHLATHMMNDAYHKKVSDLMHKIVSLPAEANLQQAIATLKSERVSLILVQNEDDNAYYVLTAKQLYLALLQK